MTLALPRPDTVFRVAFIGLALVLSCAVGLITPYLLVLLGLIAFLWVLFGGKLAAALRDGTALGFAGCVLVLAICYTITARAPGDVALALNFIMLLLYGPVHWLLGRGAREGNIIRMADAALLGTIVAFVAAVVGVYFLRWGRAQSPWFGAILLANTALVLGFLSLAGVIARGKRTLVYLLAPVLAIAVVVLSGSRGPLLAVPPLLLGSIWCMGRAWGLSRWMLLTSMLIAAGLLALAIGVLGGRAGSIAQIVSQLAGAGALDNSASVRLILWEAGYRAFLEQPLFGHGWARLMTAVQPYLAPEQLVYTTSLPQLHNDVVNFAVAAGVVGVLVYLALLAIPIVAAWRSPRDSQWLARLFAIGVLVTTYVFAGLTDLMFGFEFHTALYGAVTAIVLGYCRDRPPQP